MGLGVPLPPSVASLALRRSLADRTQTGHVLGRPPPRGAVVVSDRELSPAVFLLIRLLTHLALLLGAARSPQVPGRTGEPNFLPTVVTWSVLQCPFI